jgi:tRNA dimethylallyltransferase
MVIGLNDLMLFMIEGRKIAYFCNLLFNHMNSSPYNLLVVTGPTATGKTSFAASLASRIDGEIISADSRQVYRLMDLGTGKDIADYTVNGTAIPYHLIDIVEPGYKYNVFEYQSDFFKAFNDIQQRGKWPVMCGGSGLYVESVIKHYKLISVPVNEPLRESLSGKSLEELTHILSTYKSLHNQTDTDTVARAIRAIEIEVYYAENNPEDVTLPALNPLVIGIGIDRESRRKRITERLKVRLEDGMIEEARLLLSKGLSYEDLIYYGLEYKYLALYLQGCLSWNEMFEQLEVAIHQFAKRQMTWFRRMERNGITIHWVDAFMPMEQKIEMALRLLQGHS